MEIVKTKFDNPTLITFEVKSGGLYAVSKKDARFEVGREVDLKGLAVYSAKRVPATETGQTSNSWVRSREVFKGGVIRQNGTGNCTL